MPFKEIVLVSLLFTAIFLPIIGGVLCALTFASYLMDEYESTMDMTVMPCIMIFLGHTTLWVLIWGVL
jgi:hypothetical protein